MSKNIVRNQTVSYETLARAQELRRHMTRAENWLWQALRRSQLAGYHFRRQQVIDGFIVDFYCNGVGLVVELDGPIHEQQQDRDAERTRVLEQRNLTVVRFANELVLADREACLVQILAMCRRLEG